MVAEHGDLFELLLKLLNGETETRQVVELFLFLRRLITSFEDVRERGGLKRDEDVGALKLEILYEVADLIGAEEFGGIHPVVHAPLRANEQLHLAHVLGGDLLDGEAREELR